MAFNFLGDLLGFNGDQGDYFKSQQLNNKGTQSLAEMLAAARSSNVSNATDNLVGGQSLSSITSNLNGDEKAALASGPISGNIVAADQVKSDPILSSLYGDGGQLTKAEGQADDLYNQKFKLQPEDVEAYGQASGNIARMFGQQDQSLSSSLASRGMAAGGGGGSVAQFTGVQGNKNEALGQMQMQIANDRMNNTMQRLNQTRQYISQLGSQANQAEENQFQNNLAGANARVGMASSLAGNQRNDYQVQTAADEASKASQLANKKKSLGDAFSSGAYKAVEGLTSGAMMGNASPSGGNRGVSEDGSSGAGDSGYYSGSVGGGMSSGGSSKAGGFASLASMFSDRNLKQDIEELFSIPVFSYRYKNEEHGKGPHASPMAQDLEATELGRSAVFDTPEGKVVDYARLCPLMFAQIVLLTKQLSELKGAQ